VKRRKSPIKILFFVCLILAVLAIFPAVIFLKGGKDDSIAVTVEKVELRTVTSEVSATGRIYPEVEVKISSEVSGEIIELPVVEGQLVEKGDLLVKIDPEIYETQLRQRKVSLNSAKAQVLQAKAQLLQAESDLRRIDELYEGAVTTEKELTDARTTKEIRSVQLEAAELEVERQVALLEEMQEALSKTSVYAPMTGTITQLNSELGERVVGTAQYQGTEIMRVADLNNMEVRVEVSETDIVNVKVGDLAKIEVDAMADEEFIGHVTEISSSAASIRENNDQLTTFEVRIRLEEPSEKMRPGMTATADIQTETAEDALAVPLQSVTVMDKGKLSEALGEKPEKDPAESDMPKPDSDKDKESKRDNLQRIVYVVVGGEALVRKVETGIADTSHIVITDGLSEGDQVVSGSYQAITKLLKHKAKVRVEEKPSFGAGNWKKP